MECLPNLMVDDAAVVDNSGTDLSRKRAASTPGFSTGRAALSDPVEKSRESPKRYTQESYFRAIASDGSSSAMKGQKRASSVGIQEKRSKRWRRVSDTEKSLAERSGPQCRRAISVSYVRSFDDIMIEEHVGTVEPFVDSEIGCILGLLARANLEMDIQPSVFHELANEGALKCSLWTEDGTQLDFTSPVSKIPESGIIYLRVSVRLRFVRASPARQKMDILPPVYMDVDTKISDLKTYVRKELGLHWNGKLSLVAAENYVMQMDRHIYDYRDVLIHPGALEIAVDTKRKGRI